MRLARTILAVILGYLIFAITAVALFRLSGRDPHASQPTWFMALAVFSGMAFAVVGALVAGALASHRPHVYIALALLIAVGASVSLVTSPSSDATWSQWTALLLMAPSAYLAGRVQHSRRAS